MSGSSTTCCATWRRSEGRCRCSRSRLARLWEHRDRERGLLTRRGYEDIGGVAGALAQHAEATLETIGAARVPIVREILRNLVTAEGTRALQGWDELLSAFADQQVKRRRCSAGSSRRVC